jgi:TonB family protein
VRARFLLHVCAVIPLLLTPQAFAQPQQPAAPVLVPPELLQHAQADLPEGAMSPGERVVVVLVLLVQADGTVGEASLAEGVGEPFDSAALEAARRLVFRPATRDGTAIPARIRFQYAFVAPEPPPPPPEPEPPAVGVLTGRILDGSEAPVSGARIFLDAGGDEETRETRTGDDGSFTFTDLPPGDYLLSVAADGFETPDDSTETVRAGEATEVTLRLERERRTQGDDGEPTLGVRAEVDRPRRETTRRSIPRELLTTVPGTRGDALRVVELLPGVARPPFGSGALRIRGAAPGDSEVFVDGVSVPLLYHFGGLTSFYNSRLLERIDFYPGNFSVRFGRRIGGILEVEPRDPAQDAFHGVLDINLLDSSILIEAPLGDRAGIALAARRSYVDFFFAEIVPDDLFDVIAAPVYYDYQLIFSWRPTDQDRIRLLIYGSSDEFRTIFNGDDFARPFGLELATQFHRGSVAWRHIYDDRLQQDIMFAGGWTGLVIQAGQAFGFNAEFVPLTFRSEWDLKLHEQVRLRWGIDWQFTPTQLSFRGPAPTQSEGTPDSAAPGSPRAAAAFRGDAYRPALYVESSLNPVEPLTVVAGLRLDYFRDIQDWTFDPRLSFRLALDRQWTIKGGVGLFSQPPEFQESAPGLGNPNLEPITALHTSAGVELRLDRTWRFDVELYYKHIYRRVVGTDAGLPPFFTNDGIGRIYGAELSARADPTPGFPIYGLLSYTLSRSERLDRDGDWRLFDFDQTHILSLAVVWRIGDGWEAGATFRLVSGNPFTPVTGSVYDVRADTYRPIYGAVNSERNPFFHRLDLRLEKVFQIDTGRLALYVDVQNVYNAENREATTYSFDFRESTGIPGLPILPSLGIRGEL